MSRTWRRGFACLVLAGLPAQAFAYEATIVVTGELTEFCGEQDPRDVPFTARIRVPRASWPDGTHENWDVFWDDYWTGVVADVEVGDRSVVVPVGLHVANVPANDSISGAGEEGGESFSWRIASGPIVGWNRELAELGSPVDGWAYSHAEVHSAQAGCDWVWLGSHYYFGPIDEVTIAVEPVATHPVRARTTVCARRDVLISADGAVTTMPWLAWEGSVTAEGRVAMRGTSVIAGTAYVGTNLVLDNRASVDGAFVGGQAFVHDRARLGALAPLPGPLEPCSCAFDVSASFAEVAAANDDALLAAVPGFDGVDLSMSGGVAELPAGRFFLRNLTLRNGAVLRPPPSGVAELHVRGMVQVLGGSELGSGGRADDAARLVLISGARLADGTHVRFRGGSSFTGHLVAPLAPVYVSDGSLVLGTMNVLELELGSSSTILAPSYVERLATCH